MKIKTYHLFKLIVLACLLSIGLNKAGLPSEMVILLIAMYGSVVYSLVVEKNEKQ